MKRRSSLFSLPPWCLAFLTFPLAILHSEPPRVFSDPAGGVAHAREGDRLILFLLLDSFAPESATILTAVNEELAGRGGEFAIVRCLPTSSDHRQLFQDRFRQDPAKLPLAVVATPAGDVVAGTNGNTPDSYRLMIRAARVQSGRETDPKMIAAVRDDIAGGEASPAANLFGLRKEDVMNQKVALIETRDWTFVNGTRLRASLLEARGATGIFVKADGSEVELNFNSLSAADQSFLTQKLSPP